MGRHAKTTALGVSQPPDVSDTLTPTLSRTRERE
jgi:hypothetical protein